MSRKVNIILIPGREFGWQIAKFGAGTPSRAAIMALFWSCVKRGDADACWPFQDSDDPATYASAAEFSWLAARGPVPAGALLVRSCGSAACVNPGHLSLSRVSA